VADFRAEAVEAVRADRDALLEVCTALSDADWKAESGCPGWSVRDVVTHMGALFTALVAPTTLPDTTGLATERAQDVYVDARRGWPVERVMADYEAVSEQALTALAGLARAADRQVDLGDLGSYPAALVPCAFAFDHFVHIRLDLFAPRGPLTGTPPPADQTRLAAAAEWIEAALPQQNRSVLADLVGSVEIAVQDPGRRTIRLGAGGRSLRVVTGSMSFVRWITGRGGFDGPDVEVFGDPQQVSVLRRLRVW
jgi:uncharacterized protein (TIGR03083 family)